MRFDGNSCVTRSLITFQNAAGAGVNALSAYIFAGHTAASGNGGRSFLSMPKVVTRLSNYRLTAAPAPRGKKWVRDLWAEN